MNEEILKRLDLLAAKLGVAADRLWQTLIRQAPITASVHLALLVCALIAGLILFRWGFKTEREQAQAPLVIIGGFILVYTLVAIYCQGPAIAAAFLNPEYWALQEIMGALR